jgi:transcriptional antiterminator NusG
MVDENETLAGAEMPQEEMPAELAAEQAEAADLDARLEAQPDAVNETTTVGETAAVGETDAAEPATDESEVEEVSLSESAQSDASGEAAEDERDLSQAADQETEVDARLDDDLRIEEPAAANEEVEDLGTPELEDPAVAEEAAPAPATPTRQRRERTEERAARLSEEGVPDFSQVPQADSESDGRAWYVVHCYSGYENKVRHNLEQRIESMGMKDKIFDVVVPTEEEIEVKEGKRRTVERRVFPGYILVNMLLGEESWYVVRNTPGVTSFVGQGNTPLPLRPEEVSQIVKRMEADAPRIKVTFRQGERVRIVDGPFNDFRGTVSEIDMERAKVRVMVNFFGRETPVELDFLQVEKA